MGFKDNKKHTEKLATPTTIISLVIGLLFLSSNITGNAVVDLTTQIIGFLGVGLIIIGLVSGFLWLKAKKE